MSAGVLELVGSSLFRFDLVPMLGSLLEFWDSFGLGSVKNRNLMPQGRPRDAKNRDAEEILASRCSKNPNLECQGRPSEAK